MKDPDAFDRARAEFRRKTAHMTEAEVDAEIDRVIHEVRHEHAVRYRSTAKVTRSELTWRQE